MSYQGITVKESGEPLVDLATFDFVLEPAYFNQGFSAEKRMFLREGVAGKLEHAQNKLKKYKFKIWDGFRPPEVQKAIYQNFWERLEGLHPEWNQDRIKKEVEMYVAPYDSPDRIAPHTTGGAVDLTLVDNFGKELDMGTYFDFFGSEAHYDFFDTDKTKEIICNNRRLLREALIAEGFSPDQYEWWHFDYGNLVWAEKLTKPFAIYGEVSTFLHS